MKVFKVTSAEDLPIKPEHVDYCSEACLEDFLSRIDVKGSYKKRDLSKIFDSFDEYKKKKKEADKD